MRLQDKPCCNSKSKGIHLAHNIRIRLAQLKKKNLRPDRTVASTETNDTSTESSDTKLFANGTSEDVDLSRGLHAYLLQKDIEQKSEFNGAKSGRKKNKIIVLILFLYYEH